MLRGFGVRGLGVLVGASFSVLVCLSIVNGALAQDGDRLAWQFSEATDPDNKGRMTARLVLGIPETDTIQVTGVCDATPGTSANFSSLTFVADIGSLANGTEADLRFSGGGVEHTVKGHVQRAEGEEGLSGFVATIAHSDALWTLLAEKPALEYVIPGYTSSDLPLGNGRETIQRFVDACRSYAKNAAAKPEGGTSGSSDGSAEKDAFESAKELGTADAWNAFLASYPVGFRADLARAYLKKAAAGASPAAPTLATVTATEVLCRDRPKLRSRNSNTAAKIRFRNHSGMYRALLWIDFDGTPKDHAGLNPGEEILIDTYVTHPWMIATGPGDCIQIFMPGAGAAEINLLRASIDDGPAKSAPPAPKPPVAKKKSPLEHAKANCKETGGYWTGSACKASKASRPQKCKRGYAWSEEAGACQWDGGPPKAQQPQQNPGQQIQQFIQGLQDTKAQGKCKPPRTWDAGSKTCDCPGDSVFKGGKCVKENVP